MLPIPLRPSLAAWFRSQAGVWRTDSLARMKRAQEIRGWAARRPAGHGRDAEIAEAARLEREAEGLYGSFERWAP